VIFYVLAVACGATFYLSRLITHQRILDAPRAWVVDHAPEIIGYFVRCTWCVSFWVAGGVVLVLDRFATVPLPWAVILTASAVTGIVEAHIPED
jgi:Protein of unknown function (DUF1360)